jgi:hypothetical protein
LLLLEVQQLFPEVLVTYLGLGEAAGEAAGDGLVVPPPPPWLGQPVKVVAKPKLKPATRVKPINFFIHSSLTNYRYR